MVIRGCRSDRSAVVPQGDPDLVLVKGDLIVPGIFFWETGST